MSAVIKINPNDLELITTILNQYLPKSTIVRVFGSRANSTPKPFSDLDLAIDNGTELSYSTLIDLKHAFDESDLPYKVDIVDMHAIDPFFYARLLSTSILLTRTSS